MGLIITPQEQIDAYFERNDMSKSLMTTLLKGIDEFLTRRDGEFVRTRAMIVGSAVDTILTGEKGQFEKEYYVSEIEKKPSDAETAIIELVFERVVEDINLDEDDKLGDFISVLAMYEVAILEACEDLNWNARYKDETKIKNIVKVGEVYFEDLKKSYGKVILSKEEKMSIDAIVMSLASHPDTQRFFDRNTIENTSNIDVYFQLPVYFEYRSISCKALLDIVFVVKNQEGGIQAILPVDLKTMEGKTVNFLYKLKMFRYDIQGAWYSLALQKYFEVEAGRVMKFQFVVESTTIPGMRPLVFEMTDELLDIGKNGRPSLEIDGYIIQKEVRGYDSLLDEYLWYEENGWNEERVISESNGVLELGWNGIIEKNEPEHKTTTL